MDDFGRLLKVISFGEHEGAIIYVEEVVEGEVFTCSSGALGFEEAILKLRLHFVVCEVFEFEFLGTAIYT